ncbi:MAG: hypothetical protein ABIS18_02740 [Actinomycetota bacterium]
MATWKKTVLLVIGYLALVIDGAFYIVFAGLLVPAYALPFLWAIWGGFVVLAIRWRKRPWRVLIVGAGAFLVWLLIVTLGSILLGWTA